MDLEVSEAARRLAEKAKARNTVRAYDGDWQRFRTWCERAGRTAMPASPQTLAEYVLHLTERGARGRPAAPSTIRRALATIATMHKLAGAARPTADLATETLNGYRRMRAAAGVRVRQVAALSLASLRAMVDACDPGTVAGRRDRALLVLGWSLMARRSELVAFDVADIRRDERGLVVFFALSKTDQDAAGVEVALPFGDHEETCPVRLTLAWCDELPSAGPLFRRVDRHDRLAGAGPAAGVGSADGRMDPSAVRRIVRRAATRAGLAGAVDLSAHSLRSGGATGAREAGKDLLEIARHGRWRDASPVVLRYIRTVDRWRGNAMSGVGL